VNSNSPALKQALDWKSSRPADAAIMQKIGNQSAGIWFGGWNADLKGDVERVMMKAKETNSIPTLVAYNIPARDCGGYSSGGANSIKSYSDWMNRFSAGIGSGKAIVILEPDSLAGITCLSNSMQTDRYAMLKNAVSVLKTKNPNAKIYIDAGHANWIDSTTMSSRLIKSGLSGSVGFSLNVSNFVSTDDNIKYGQALSQKTNGAHFVIDTSRNGLGSNGEWCNPSGRALGQSPSLSTGKSLVDAYLWIKPVGESDGSCNGGPSAGSWWAEYALDMAKRANY
jgi:endoglucanase